MMIHQPDRILLRQEVGTYAPELSGDILDVGGGSGKRYRHMFPQAKSYRSIDFNPNEKPDIVGDAENMPLPDSSIDGVVCSQMLEHVPHPWKVLSEIARVLKPGGKAILTVPQQNEIHEEPYDFYRYTNFGVKILCEEAGLKILKTTQRGRYHTFMAQSRIRKWIDMLRPYERTWAMYILAPWSAMYCKYALMMDKLDRSEASSRHVIGWTFLLEKSR